MRTLYKSVLQHGEWSRTISDGVTEGRWVPNGTYSFESSLFDYVDRYSQEVETANTLCGAFVSGSIPSPDLWAKPLSVIFYFFEIARGNWEDEGPAQERAQARELLKKLSGLDCIGSKEELDRQRFFSSHSEYHSNSAAGHATDLSGQGHSLGVSDFGVHVLREAMKSRHGRRRDAIENSITEFTKTRDAILETLSDMAEMASSGRNPTPIPLVALVQEVVRLTEGVLGKPLVKHGRLARGKKPDEKVFAHQHGDFVLKICHLVDPTISAQSISTAMRSMPVDAPAQKQTAFLRRFCGTKLLHSAQKC